MKPDEYRRLSAACRAMAAQSSNPLTDERIRWFRLAERSSDLADAVAAKRPIYVGRPSVEAASTRPRLLDG